MLECLAVLLSWMRGRTERLDDAAVESFHSPLIDALKPGAGKGRQCTAVQHAAACLQCFLVFPVRMPQMPQMAKHCNGEVSSVLCSCGGRLSTFEACALFLREAEAADGS